MTTLLLAACLALSPSDYYSTAAAVPVSSVDYYSGLTQPKVSVATKTPQKPVERTAQSGYYPTRSGNWTHPGNTKAGIIQHLLTADKHRGKFTQGYLETLSYSELESLHSDDHENRVRRQYVTASAAPKQKKSYGPVGNFLRYTFGSERQMCPGPNCPYGR